MSVVNDVLRELDNRKRDNNHADAPMSFLLSSSNIPGVNQVNYYKPFTIILFAGVFSFIGYSFYATMFANQKGFNVLDIPITDIQYQIIPSNIESQNANRYPTHRKYLADKKILDTSENPLYEKDAPNLNSEAITQEEISTSKQKVLKPYPIVSRRSTSPSNYASLLTIPLEKIWMHIQSAYPDVGNNPKLLAIAAQGEQRSERHQSAVELYTRLVELSPQEAKWKVGLAISLEKLKHYDAAIENYSEAKKSTVSTSLNQFVNKRLTYLRERNRYEE